MSAPSNPTAANGSKHWMVITNRLCGRKAMAHSVSAHRCWTKPPNTSKTKRRVIAAEHSSMNTNNSWMHTMWNMMNGMRLGIDFFGGFYFPFFSAGVYTKFCCIFFHRQGFTPPAYNAVTPSGFRYFLNSAAITSFSFLAASSNMLSSVGTGTGWLSKRLKVSAEQASRSPLMVV